MGSAGIILGVVSPHPPIVVPEIAESNIERVRGTMGAMQRMARLVADLNPDTVVVISPHGPVLHDRITLLSTPILEGNFREFGIMGSSLRYGNDLRLVNRIVAEAEQRDVAVVAGDPQRAASLRFPAALHYSVLVPLYYLKQAGYESRLVAGAAGLLSYDESYRFGQAVQAAARALGVRVVYVASGDLSHCLREGAPAGYDPMGRVFDERVVEALAGGDAQALKNLDPELVDRAGQCGLGPIVSMFGALDDLEVFPEVLSYEGPFGVGYCVATFLPKAPAPARTSPAPDTRSAPGEHGSPESGRGSPAPAGPTEARSGAGPGAPAPEWSEPAAAGGAEAGSEASEPAVAEPADTGSEPVAAEPETPPLGPGAAEPTEAGPAGGAGSGETSGAAGGGQGTDEEPPGGANEGPEAAGQPQPLVRLARLALETFVREGRRISPPAGAPGLDRRAGAFVSLKKRGNLRGCIGTIEATTASLAEEVIRNAIQSGTADPRFPPVSEAELGELSYSVDVLEPAEPVSSLDQLDPKVYGVIVNKGHRTGLLLPDLEGVDTVETQVAIACQKAGIAPGETGVRLFRFKVTRYH